MSKQKPAAEQEKFKADITQEVRPWGKFRCFPHQKAGALKIITVNPGGVLSLQYHHHRSEFWVVLDEGLEMTLGEKVWKTKPNEEIFIPAETPHRIRNTGSKTARIMEIWIGPSAEEDIVRLQDDYGRTGSADIK
ncbi:MAG: phosphomannose isomerase type II C-terminal cupin domain [Candidatus Aminicenantes bacterium]